jgi:hypothetical protein
VVGGDLEPRYSAFVGFSMFAEDIGCPRHDSYRGIQILC